MDVEKIMVGKVISVKADATVKDAVDLMNRYDIGCLVVDEDGEINGIITERDVMKRVISKSRSPEETKVSDVMSKPLIIGGPMMYVEDAARLMFMKNIKKLPIMKNGRITGIITFSDIARVSNVEPQMAKVIEELKKNGWLPSKRMKKVADFYIV